jgi:hypothetical protein
VRKVIWVVSLVIAVAILVLVFQKITHYIEKRDIRQSLFSELEPVKLSNCIMKRFGAPNDGGYLMCENLLDRVQSAIPVNYSRRHSLPGRTKCYW